MKAVISKGRIQPLEPLPRQWKDGQELLIEAVNEANSSTDLDRDFKRLGRLCAKNDPADDERLMSAMAESRRLAKEEVRRRMGRKR